MNVTHNTVFATKQGGNQSSKMEGNKHASRKVRKQVGK